MPSDYERIRQENIREYGEGKRHLGFLGKLYADSTHFLFELLQNAEDAGASQLKFSLHKNRLDIWHNGRLFNERDVRGVCGVGEGTKAEDMGKIGKFGIGFKSVYAYTRRPSIYSGDECFAIEDYVRPVALNRFPIPNRWTTLISLPFDEKVVHPDTAHRDIHRRLRSLSARTILFLRHLRQVDWEVEGVESGSLSRDFRQRGPARQEMAITERDGNVHEETWLVFERPVSLPKGSHRLASGEYEVFGRTMALPSGKESLKVEIAFFLEQDKKKVDRIATAQDPRLVVFFPTDKDTELGFLMQGLYSTTPARDNIRLHDSWNEYLIQETAQLLVESLEALKGLGLLSVQAINTLPLRPSKFGKDNPFRPIFDAVRTALRERPLLPAQSEGFVAARDARLARGTGLIELFSPPLLGKLLGSGKPLQWLSSEISLDRTPDLYRYLVGRFDRSEDPEGVGPLVERIEVRPDTVLAQLTPSFLDSQSDEWMVQLYSFFSRSSEAETRKALRTKEIIRLTTGRHVAAYGTEATPRVYLPSAAMSNTGFPTVKETIARHPRALDFLKGLGLAEPNVATEVLERVLPKYSNSVRTIDEAVYVADVRKILQALAAEQQATRDLVAEQARKSSWVRAHNPTTGAVTYKLPGEVYRPSPQIALYFEGHPNVWLMDLPAELLTSFQPHTYSLLGIANKPRRVQIKGSLSEQRKIQLREGSSGWTRDLAIIDYELDGLEHFLKRCGKESDHTALQRALVLWGFLFEHLGQSSPKEEFFQGRYEWFFRTGWYSLFEARFVTRLREHAWLPSTISHRLCPPRELKVEYLPPSFRLDDTLLAALDIRPDPLKELASQAGMSLDDLRLVQKHREEFDEWKRSMQRVKPEAEDQPSDAFNFVEALAKAFGKDQQDTGDGQNDDGHEERGASGGYRERAKEAIIEEMGKPPRARFRKVERKVWEAKNSAVREFLVHQYQGKCQICHSAFMRRDNKPYFEGIYLVPYTKADWIDQEGNILCLCPTCAAKFLHGSVEADDILEQIGKYKAWREGGDRSCKLRIRLCGEQVEIRYREKHMLRLQALLQATTSMAHAAD